MSIFSDPVLSSRFLKSQGCYIQARLYYIQFIEGIIMMLNHVSDQVIMQQKDEYNTGNEQNVCNENFNQELQVIHT